MEAGLGCPIVLPSFLILPRQKSTQGSCYSHNERPGNLCAITRDEPLMLLALIGSIHILLILSLPGTVPNAAGRKYSGALNHLTPSLYTSTLMLNPKHRRLYPQPVSTWGIFAHFAFTRPYLTKGVRLRCCFDLHRSTCERIPSDWGPLGTCTGSRPVGKAP